MTDKRIRGGSGLGDSIYCRPVVDHYVRSGHRVVIKSNYPAIFAGSGATVEPFTRLNTNVLAHYSSRKARPETTQWEDVAINAGVPGLPFSITWEIKSRVLIKEVKARADHRPIVLVNGGRPPMGRADGYGHEMLPARSAFDSVLGNLKDVFTVKIGKGAESYPLRTDMDLSERTSPADLLDLASVASGLVGQCSFMIPLAESLGKPLLVVWAAAGLKSATEFIRLCRPEKILSKPTSLWVMDDASPEEMTAATERFCEAMGVPVA